jgi:hypothetical protein
MRPPEEHSACTHACNTIQAAVWGAVAGAAGGEWGRGLGPAGAGGWGRRTGAGASGRAAPWMARSPVAAALVAFLGAQLAVQPRFPFKNSTASAQIGFFIAPRPHRRALPDSGAPV